MHKLIIIFVFAVVSIHIQAEKPGFMIGASGNYCINIPGKWTSSHSARDPQLGYGGAIGVTGRYVKSSHLFFETGIGLSYNNLKLYDADYTAIDKKIDKYSVYLPLNIGWKFELDDSFYISPMASIETSFVLGGGMDDRHLVGKTGVWRRWNIAAGFGVGIMFNNISIGTLGYFGLLNMVKDHKAFHRNFIADNYVKVFATYYFKSY